MSKKYDLVVKVGEYPDGNGGKKAKYKNIGVIMENDKGPFMLLDKTFNPAGVPGQEGKESIIVSMFEPRPQGQPLTDHPHPSQGVRAQQQSAPQQNNGGVDNNEWSE